MADPSTLSTAALMELQREQKDLIDTIDKLRALGVGGIVDLPQIIVVGDQSSGKSSVLEAISQHKFPAKDGICTRFATQLSLRRSATPSAKVSIETNGSDDPELRPFEASDFDSDQEVGDIIEEAKQKMSAKIAQDGVSEDILHIEISGPDMPMLTLVDLPGFYHSETKDQSAEGIAIVERLANRYMSQKSSIILTIVSGKYDIALQTVHNRVLQHDPQGLRTMGIITKADFIRANSQFLSLARNEEPKYRYGLGWHVLRNRTEDEADISNEERDATEDRLFQSQIWRDFPQKSKGIKALRQRLSNALYQHIKKNMPGLVEELRTQIKTREAQLERLGPARASPQELRYYLTTISTRFARLADYAIKGYYIDAFFEGPGSEARRDGSTERIHKLRALVRNLNCVFYETMLTKGHSRAIVDPDNVLMNNNVMFRPSGLSQAVKQAMGPWLDHYDFPDPKPVSLNELMAQIDVRATDNRGTELPGSANDDLAVSEFKEQSSRWESIATRHIETISDVSQTFVEELLAYIIGSDRHSHNSIMAEVVEPFFEERRLTLKAKLAELLRHFKHGSPQPLDAEFRERMELRQQKRLLGQKAPGDLNGRRRVHSSSEDVIEKMMTCYDVSSQDATLTSTRMN
jgi:GTP-binding protein EngB required for normal cell division